jgi:hypothetical protein
MEKKSKEHILVEINVSQDGSTDICAFYHDKHGTAVKANLENNVYFVPLKFHGKHPCVFRRLHDKLWVALDSEELFTPIRIIAKSKREAIRLWNEVVMGLQDGV